MTENNNTDTTLKPLDIPENPAGTKVPWNHHHLETLQAFADKLQLTTIPTDSYVKKLRRYINAVLSKRQAGQRHDTGKQREPRHIYMLDTEYQRLQREIERSERALALAREDSTRVKRQLDEARAAHSVEQGPNKPEIDPEIHLLFNDCYRHGIDLMDKHEVEQSNARRARGLPG